MPVAYFTKEVNASLAKLLLNLNVYLSKLGLTSLVKWAALAPFTNMDQL